VSRTSNLFVFTNSKEYLRDVTFFSVMWIFTLAFCNLF